MDQEREDSSIEDIYQKITHQVVGGIQYLRGELIDDTLPLLDQQSKLSQYLSISEGFKQLVSGDFAKIKIDSGYRSSVFQRGNAREIAAQNAKIKQALDSYIKANVLSERSFNGIEEDGLLLAKTFLNCFAHPSGLYPKSDDVNYGGAFVDFSFYNSALLESAKIDGSNFQDLARMHTEFLLDSDQRHLIPEDQHVLIPTLIKDMQEEIRLETPQRLDGEYQQQVIVQAEQQRVAEQAEQQRVAEQAEQQRVAEQAEQQRVAAEQEKQNYLSNEKAAIYSLQHTNSFVSLTNKISSSAFGIDELVDKDLVNYFTSTLQLGLSLDYARLGGDNSYSTVLASSINLIDKTTNLFDFENQLTKCFAKVAASSILTAAVLTPLAGAREALISSTLCITPKASIIGMYSPATNLIIDTHSTVAEKITDVVRIVDSFTDDSVVVQYLSEHIESMKDSTIGALGYSYTDEL